MPAPHKAPASPLVSLEAEQACIGGVFYSPVKFADIAATVAADDFSDELHRRIFATMQALDTAGQPIDLLTVGEAMEAKGALQDGEWSYIARLAQDTPSAANVLAYASVVRNRARCRALAALGAELQQWALHDRDAERTLNRLQGALERFSATGNAVGPVHVSELLNGAVDAIDRRFNGVEPVGLGTGLPDLDKLIIGLQAGRLYLVAGRPAMGKSVLALQIAAHLAAHHRQRTLIFSAEMPSAENVERLIASFGRIDLGRLQSGRLDDADWERLPSAVAQIAESQLWFDETPSPSLQEILSKSRRMHRQKPLGMVVVDHAGLVTHGGENRTQSQSAVAIALKALAKELRCPVIALVQLNRKLEDRGDKRPVLSDLRESGEWEQSADVVAAIYRDEVYSPDSPDKGYGELIIRKQRGGALGTVPLRFIGEHSRFESITGGLPSWERPSATSRGVEF